MNERFVTTCPECNGILMATAVIWRRYYGTVLRVDDETGAMSVLKDGDQYGHDDVQEFEVYCENGHEYTAFRGASND